MTYVEYFYKFNCTLFRALTR